jgi:radical SAM protein with 4Fe4S-binding SPASM domain
VPGSYLINLGRELRVAHDLHLSGSLHGPLAVDDVDLSPLTPAGIVDGKLAVAVGGDYVFSNDVLLKGLQAFPGQRLPTMRGRPRFPVPDQVGQYCDADTFRKAPKFMAQWVHWPQRTRMILEGRYHELPPVHFEGIFTLVCNFMCPHCSRRVTRSKWVDGGTWAHTTEVERRNTMHPDGIKRVIDEMVTVKTDHQMGIVWGGGDPTANPFTYDAMRYARSKGILASFLTNGVYLDCERALDVEPILIRISLNCGTEQTYRRFHGYPKGLNAFDRVRSVMRNLAKLKVDRGAQTLIGISLIMDDRNLSDMAAAAAEIRAVVESAGGGIDYVIVRPVMNYSHFSADWAKLSRNTASEAWSLAQPGGVLYDVLQADLGIPVIPIKDSFDAPPEAASYRDTRCLAYGMAGEIRHNGDVQLCSDSYGDPQYTIGNLFEQSLAEIWQSQRRTTVLEAINARACFQTKCPHNSRGHHYNRLFHQIEHFRRAGRLDEVRRWVDELRATTYPLGHSFFL